MTHISISLVVQGKDWGFHNTQYCIYSDINDFYWLRQIDVEEENPIHPKVGLMQNAATTTNLKRHLFILLILWPNVLFHNSGSQPTCCSLTTFQLWINTGPDLAHWKRPAITHAGKATDSELIWSSFWIVVGKINAHSDLCLFLQVTFTLADLICAGGTTERPSSASQQPKVKIFSSLLSHFPSFWDWSCSFRFYIIVTPFF